MSEINTANTITALADDDRFYLTDQSDSFYLKKVVGSDLKLFLAESQAVSVLDYGTNTTPGTTDMTTAFADAATAAHARSGSRGGTVYVPGGSYRAENLPLDLGGFPIRYVGEGIDSTLIRTVSGAAGTVLALTSGIGAMRGGGFSNMTLQGDYTGAATEPWDVAGWGSTVAIHDGVDLSSLSDTDQFLLENVYLRGFREAFIGAQNDRSPTFINAHWRYNLRAVRTTADHPIFAGGCEFRYNQYAIDPVNGLLYDCLLEGVKINQNQYGVHATGSGAVRNLNWIGGLCYGNWETGITCNGGASDANFTTIQNVTFIKHSTNANVNAIRANGSHISIRNCNFVTFETNVGWTAGAIEIDISATARRIQITDNYFGDSNSPCIVKTGTGQYELCKFDGNNVMMDATLSSSPTAWVARFYEDIGSGAMYYNTFNNNTFGSTTATPGDDIIENSGTALYNLCSGNMVRYSSGVSTGYLWNVSNVNNYINDNVVRRGAGALDVAGNGAEEVGQVNWVEGIATPMPALSGAGTPTFTSTVPQFLGQMYADTSANTGWVATTLTPAVGDWVLLS